MSTGSRQTGSKSVLEREGRSTRRPYSDEDTSSSVNRGRPGQHGPERSSQFTRAEREAQDRQTQGSRDASSIFHGLSSSQERAARWRDQEEKRLMKELIESEEEYKKRTQQREQKRHSASARDLQRSEDHRRSGSYERQRPQARLEIPGYKRPKPKDRNRSISAAKHGYADDEDDRWEPEPRGKSPFRRDPSEYDDC